MPLRLRAESLSQMSTQLVDRPDAGGGWSIWQFLAAFKTQPAFDRLVILGSPGSGKTTLLEYVALVFAKGSHKRHHRGLSSYIPVLIYLREVRDLITGDQPVSLQMLIDQQLKIDGITAPANWFEDKLSQGKCLIMVDGLDEVSDLKQRRKVSEWVTQQMRLHRESPFIITSRPFGYRDAPLEGATTTLEIKPFNLEQMQQFIRSWYLQTEIVRHLGKADTGVKQTAHTQAEDLTRRIQKNASLAAMALNPLLLTMIATVHAYRGALPGKRVELYGEICDVLLGRRQDIKGIPDLLTAEQKKKVLQSLALKLMKRRTRTFGLFAGKVLIEKQLAEVTKGELSAVEFIRQVESSSGLLVERHPEVYEFAHKSLQEYLAAVQIKAINREYELTRNIDDPWWEETIRLYAAQNDASNLIWTALEKNTVKSLSVAYDCLEEAQSVSQDVRNDLEGRLGAGLESSKPEIFKLAAEVKLDRRLKRLLRLDEKTDIDLSYISCAEYQLFGDEMAERAAPEGLFRQPDHWGDRRFPHGCAKAAVVGLRAFDAQAFCDWLTQRVNSLGSVYLEAGVTVFSGPVKIRLASAKELREHPVDPSLPGTSRMMPIAMLSSWYDNSIGLSMGLPPELRVEQPPGVRFPEEFGPEADQGEGRSEAARFSLPGRTARHSPLAAQLIEQIVRDTGFIFDPILKHALTFNNLQIYDLVDDVLPLALDVLEDPLRSRDRDLRPTPTLKGPRTVNRAGRPS
ncbi:MAG: NACHT domain-containing protein, partial [Synechococcales cyanobacterium RU_4_20]|nr:NACHT domain-containing protein [Synechococcales cyanobacterium RU_4_20]